MDVLRLPSPPRASPAELSMLHCCSLSSPAANSCPACERSYAEDEAQKAPSCDLQRTVICSDVILPGEEQMQLKLLPETAQSPG